MAQIQIPSNFKIFNFIYYKLFFTVDAMSKNIIYNEVG